MENRVRYLCVDKGHGRAIVEGERAYEVEFDYADGAVSNLTCTCPCGFLCKHAVAALLQLRECLLLTEKHYSDRYENRIAAILKGDFFRFVIDRRESGSFTF